MPLCQEISSGFTSGTISGTSGSIRKVLELSITTAPALAAAGPRVLLMEPPANNAISTSSKDCSVASSTVYSLPINWIFLPADRLDANNFKLANGNFRSSIRFKNSCPTAPVAPRIATL